MSLPLSLGDASRIIDVIDARIKKLTRSSAMVENTWGTVASVDASGKTAGAYLYGETDGAYISEGFRLPDTTYVTVGSKVKVAMDYGTGERWVEEVSVPSSYKKVAFDLVNGRLYIGDGTAIGPTYLEPVDANSAGFAGGNVYIRRAALTNAALLVGAEGATTNMPFRLRADGELSWGDATNPRDTNLYRYSADRLQTDDTLGIALGNSGGLSIGTSSAPPSLGIAFGADTNLFRQAANILKTDDYLVVGSGLYVGSASTAGQSTDGLNISSGGNIEMRNANPFIDFKSSDIDFGARIIYDFTGGGYPADSLYFVGASKYAFDNTMRVVTGDLESDSTFDFFTLASAAQQLKAKSILLSTSFSDPTPNAAGIQFGADTNLYRSAANELKTDDSLVVAGDISLLGYSKGSDSSFTISGGGTATFTGKTMEWYVLGPIVVYRFGFTVNAAGSGTTEVSVTSSSMPGPASTTYISGDRGGTGVRPLGGRVAAGTTFSMPRMNPYSTGTTYLDASPVTGADLASGAGYTFCGAYFKYGA